VRIRTGFVTAALALALTVLATSARAQVTGGGGASKLGVIAGFNLVSVSFDPSVSDVFEDTLGFDSSSSGGVNGIAAGLFFEVPFGKPRLRIEGLFSQGGGKFGAGIDNIELASTSRARSFGINGGLSYEFEDKAKLNFIEVPVMVVFPLGIDEKIRVMGGAFLASILSQKETLTETLGNDTDEIEFDEDEQTQLKKITFGIALGAEVRVAPRIGVGGRFNIGLTNLNDEDDEPLFETIKFRTVRVYIVFDIM
jgi:hypothetical protein